MDGYICMVHDKYTYGILISIYRISNQQDKTEVINQQDFSFLAPEF